MESHDETSQLLFSISIGIAAVMVLTGQHAVAADAGTKPPRQIRQPGKNFSLQQEVDHAIEKGLAWLDKSQNSNGWWSTPDHPAITALALTAFRLRPESDGRQADLAPVKKGYDFLVSCVQPDGGIYRKELASYNTSVSLTALVLAQSPEYRSTIVKARKFIAGLQVIKGDAGGDDPFVGGIGYGKDDKRPDLSNTSLALEALAVSRQIVAPESTTPAAEDLNWRAAIHFIQCCQNLAEQNPASWVSDQPQDKGGFVYAPGKSMAGETNLAGGRIALRSYGSMSYAGLLSYIYADLKRDDPRVTSVVDWLRGNFTVEENPALGQQGLYYYYHMMAKALSLYGTDLLGTKNGRDINWREQLALKLINLQNADGSWANENGRWWEKDPALVTAYSLIALDLVQKRL
jgi:squalene-hopene/tetraprenyl-beta-curcumene cyclase